MPQNFLMKGSDHRPMKLTINLKNILITLLALLALNSLSLPASAASQNLSFSMTPVESGSDLASLITASSPYSYLRPLSSTQTQVTAENEGHWYAWTLNPFSSLPCPQAKPSSINVKAQNSLTTEGNPDWGALILAATDGSTAAPITPQRPVTEGYSPDAMPIYVGRWSVGAEAFPPATAEWGIGIAGPMEAVWDLADLEPGWQLALGVGHDSEDGTTGLQTTIESVTVTYDTTDCDQTADQSSTTSSNTSSVNSPKTGQITNLVIWSAALASGLFVLLKLAKHLKSKH